MSRWNGPIPYSDKARKNFDGIFKKKPFCTQQPNPDCLAFCKHRDKCKAKETKDNG